MICAPWITDTDLVDCNCPDASAAIVDSSMQSASEILFALSGRQYPGICQETIRPCSGTAVMGPGWSGTFLWYPMKWGSTWLNLRTNCGCHVSYECACGGIPQVDLGRNDVIDIQAVVIDGTPLSSSNYRLDEGRYLVRTDGEQWPCCQDLSKDITETGTWYIELDYGREPPESGKRAAAVLSSEFIKACIGSDDCTLPGNVQQVVRQGVSFVIPTSILQQGQTGLFEVDAFLAAVNPQGISRRASAWSYGMKGRARRVGVLGS